MGKGKKNKQQEKGGANDSNPKQDEPKVQGQSSDLTAVEDQRPAKGAWKLNKPKKKGGVPSKTEETEKDCTLPTASVPGVSIQPPFQGAHPKEPHAESNKEKPVMKGEIPEASQSCVIDQRPPKGSWKNKGKKGELVTGKEKEAESVPELSIQPNIEGARPKEPGNVTPAMSKLSIDEASFPQRESITKSKLFPIEKISANYLEMDLKDLPDTIYHYNITFNPDRPKKFIFSAFNQLIDIHLTNLRDRVAFDGVKSFFTLDKIADSEYPSISVASPDGTGKPKEFKITVQFTTAVDMRVIKRYPNYDSPQGTTVQKGIQTIDILMKTAFDRDGLIRFKNSVFVPPTNEEHRKHLGDNYELLIGLFQSFVMGERTFLNVDVSHKAFPSHANNLGDVYDYYTNQQGKDLRTILDGLTLVYASPMTKERKSFKFNAVRRSAKQERFRDANNKEWTVENYFKSKGIILEYPGDPCIHVGPRNQNMLIPMEFLSIPPGQALNRPAPESCKPQMVKYAAGSTMDRHDKIMSLLKEIDYPSIATIKNFGIVLGEKFIQVDSHILNPPRLQYHQKVLEIKKPGEWRADREQFLLPYKKLTNWSILILDKRVKGDMVTAFGKSIPPIASKFGLNFAKYEPANDHWFHKDDDLDNILNWFKQEQIELIFVVISEIGNQYSEVKKAAELRCGMLTQCIKTRTVNNLKPATLSNIMLKVNAKLGGTNHKIVDETGSPALQISINARPFMIIGADVTHASPGQIDIPSVVGVAASYDRTAFRYNRQWRMQINKKKDRSMQEIIEGLDEMVAEHLRVFQSKNNGILPKHILYYRDGVSEGQFAQVKETELSAIKKACQMMGDPDIQITVIIVQKRHHTRFFPDPKKPTNDCNNNVKPGTVVDSVIVDPQKWQFFMVSHISMKGVAKPTKYCVIHDDANLTNRELQVFTNNLCHLFTRCNRAVSYVAPTYYAHLVAARGRVYIQNEPIDMDQLDRENEKRHINNQVAQERPMFFV